jgi:hypothetical protein
LDAVIHPSLSEPVSSGPIADKMAGEQHVLLAADNSFLVECWVSTIGHLSYTDY